MLANPIENKLLRTDYNNTQSPIREFKHKPLQMKTFTDVEMLLNSEFQDRFVNIVVNQCTETLKYSKKLNSDLRLEENKDTLESLTKIKATNQASL
jgi:hypothetical protein